MVLAAAGAGDAAAVVPDLYEAATLVTGQGPENRGPALLRCLGLVLVKVSGDPALENDPRIATLLEQAPDAVAGLHYRDRMAGIPVHDEQGSRDRPYDLTVSFRPERIDAMIASLGRVPRTGPRPELLALIAVDFGGARFLLASDGRRGRDMRDALIAAADRYGMPLALPQEADLAAAGLADGTGAAAGVVPLPLAGAGADLALVGTLAWNETDPGWTVDWSLDEGSVTHHWRVSGVSFDDAFRAGVRGAAQILSGHGEPD